MARIPINHRILACEGCKIEVSADPAINLSDTVFEFLSQEYSERSFPSSSVDDDEEDEEKDNLNDNENGNAEDNHNFWETQQQLLQDTICRTSSLESRIRNITKEAIKESRQSGSACACGKTIDNGCRKCLMEEVCHRLQNAGFNGAICKSKWRSSPDIPSGEHTFLDVLDNSNPKRGQQVRVIIELNFRAEFEMARANEEYNKLIKRLPEIFVGKIERLLSLLKILCACAKKAMKEKKMHMGPWRKHRYMQAKWLKTCERKTSSLPLNSGYRSSLARPRVSMLTADILDNFSNLHRPAVKVV